MAPHPLLMLIASAGNAAPIDGTLPAVFHALTGPDHELWLSVEVDGDGRFPCHVEVPAAGSTLEAVGRSVRACAPPGVDYTLSMTGAYALVQQVDASSSRLLDASITLAPGPRTMTDFGHDLEAALQARAEVPVLVQVEAGLHGIDHRLVTLDASTGNAREVLMGARIASVDAPARGHVAWQAAAGDWGVSIVLVLVEPDRIPAPQEVLAPARADLPGTPLAILRLALEDMRANVANAPTDWERAFYQGQLDTIENKLAAAESEER